MGGKGKNLSKKERLERKRLREAAIETSLSCQLKQSGLDEVRVALESGDNELAERKVAAHPALGIWMVKCLIEMGHHKSAMHYTRRFKSLFPTTVFDPNQVSKVFEKLGRVENAFDVADRRDTIVRKAISDRNFFFLCKPPPSMEDCVHYLSIDYPSIEKYPTDVKVDEVAHRDTVAWILDCFHKELSPTVNTIDFVDDPFLPIDHVEITEALQPFISNFGVLDIFGSRSIDGLAMNDSDFDFNLSTKSDDFAVDDLVQLLRNSTFEDVKYIQASRVPIIQFTYIKLSKRISCEMSFNNVTSVENSKRLRDFCETNPGKVPILRQLRVWLKQEGFINKRYGLNLHSWSVLFIIYCEETQPTLTSILASIFCAFFKANSDSVNATIFSLTACELISKKLGMWAIQDPVEHTRNLASKTSRLYQYLLLFRLAKFLYGKHNN